MTSLATPLRRARSALRRLLYAILPGRVLNRWMRWRLPRTINLEATTACSLACPLCPTHIVDRRHRFLKREHVANVLEGNGAVRSVCFHIEGEPLVHPELFEFVRAFSRREVHTHFSTNGELLDRCLPALFDSGLASISIALDGVDAESHERYRRNGDFDAVVRNARALLAERARRGQRHPRVQLQTIMFSYNEDREDEVRAFLESFGPDDIALKRPSYCNDSAEWESVATHTAPPKLARARRDVDAFLSSVDHTDETRKWSRPADGAAPELYRNQRVCPQMAKGTVLCDGRVVACCMDVDGTTTFGDLGQETFAEIWRGERHRRVIEAFQDGRLGICRACTLGR